MRAAAIFLSIVLLPTLAQAADSTLVRKASAHSVAMTLDRLTTIVESKGAKVFARVPHSSGAQKVGMELRPTEALIFGNPKLGTPALQASQEMGLDLPLRVVAYEAADGKVVVSLKFIPVKNPMDPNPDYEPTGFEFDNDWLRINGYLTPTEGVADSDSE